MSDPIQVYLSSRLSISENVVQNSFRVFFDLELSEAFDRGQLPGKMATREDLKGELLFRFLRS